MLATLRRKKASNRFLVVGFALFPVEGFELVAMDRALGVGSAAAFFLPGAVSKPVDIQHPVMRCRARSAFRFKMI
jgi:hypothetical protein